MTILTRLPLHPLLFAAYAVLFLYTVNLDEVLPVDAAAPLARGVLGAALVLTVLGLVYRDARRGAIVATAVIVAFFGYGHASGALLGAGVGETAQLVTWALIVIGVSIYAARAGASVARTTAGLNAVAVVLVVVAVATILPYEATRFGREPVANVQAVAARPGTARRPDIYFLVFDRYGSAEAIERRFGITDNDLYGWLEERGFQVPAESRSSYRATDFSLASTLNMRYLDELTTRIGRVSSDRTPAQDMLREHEVGRFLQDQGYEYYHLGSWFDPTRSNEMADANLTLGIASEFESVLRETTILPAIDRTLGIETGEPTFLDRVREGTLFQFRQLHRLATAPGPKFVFAHILLPHDPYVFRADGTLITEAEVQATEERKLYADHIAYANGQIKGLVDDLLAGPDGSDPVVILQADEGPLMCQAVDCVSDSAEYLSIRLGVLNAMYLPGVDVRLPERFTSVNTFRYVLREYFGADLEPLPDRSFTWPDNDHLYDFREITHLIE